MLDNCHEKFVGISQALPCCVLCLARDADTFSREWVFAESPSKKSIAGYCCNLCSTYVLSVEESVWDKDGWSSCLLFWYQRLLVAPCCTVFQVLSEADGRDFFLFLQSSRRCGVDFLLQ